MTFVGLLRLGKDHPGCGPAFVGPDDSAVSFDRLWSDVDHLAGALHARGLRAHDRAAILSTDSAEYVVALLACLRLGVIYIPLNYRLAEREIGTLLEHSRPDLAFVAERYACVIDALPGAVRPRLTVSLDLASRGDDSVAGMIAAGRPSPAQYPTLDEDVVSVCYTSGTTGRPKGVMQSQRSMRAELRRHEPFRPSAGDVHYTASPMFHVAGHRTIFTHLASGCTSLLMPQFDAELLAARISAGGLDGAFLVPTMLDQLVTAMDGRTGRLPVLLYGGSAISPNLLRRVTDVFDARLFNLFGSTEAGLVSLLGPDDHRSALRGRTHLLGSLGRPSAGTEVRLCEPSGTEVANGAVGEIVCRTDGVMSGYLEMPDETGAVLRDGWMWTGDLALRDDDGYYFYAGRSRDTIIRGGENIYPAEIEDVIMSLPGVSAAAVIGGADEHWGEVVVAFVEHGGTPPLEAEILRQCRAHLGSFKLPSSIVFTTELPRTAAGKVAKHVLREAQR